MDELSPNVGSPPAVAEYIGPSGQQLYATLFEHSPVTGLSSVSNRFSIPRRLCEDVEMLSNARKALDDWIESTRIVKAVCNTSSDCDPWSFLDAILCPFCQVRLTTHDFPEHLRSCVSSIIEEIPVRERSTFESVLCGRVDSVSGGQCMNFRSICREHRHINFPNYFDGTQICGYPYVFHAFLSPFSISQACLVSCNKCSKHWGWKQALQALLDSALFLALTGQLAAESVVVLEKLVFRLSSRLHCLTCASQATDTVSNGSGS